MNDILKKGGGKKTMKKLCVLMFAVCVFASTTVLAAEDARVFFAPQSMNEDDEIIVPIYTENLPKDNDGLCGMEFKFAYNTEHFTLKADEDGRPLLKTDLAMLVQNTDIVEVAENNGVVSVSYVDFSGGDNVVLRDGPLFYFTLIPKNPNALWNSDDYYPIRFLADSVNLIMLDKKNLSLSGISAEGIDTYVGGYNVYPTFEIPQIEDKIDFKDGVSAVFINGEEKTTDAPPYKKDELMIPLRALAEACGMEIYWDGETQTVSMFYPYISVYFDMKNGNTYINAKRRTDLGEAEIVNGRTFAPVSAIRAMFKNMLGNDGDNVLSDFNKKEEEEK